MPPVRHDQFNLGPNEAAGKSVPGSPKEKLGLVKLRSRFINSISPLKPSLRRCSALVRLADGNADLFVGHTTWEPYSEMNRIVKFYDFPFKGVAARGIAVSSYPATITSTDEFIITSNGIVLTETTIDTKNKALFRDRTNIKSGN